MKISRSTKLLSDLYRIALVAGMVLHASGEGLRKESAQQLRATLSHQCLATLKAERNAEVEARAITLGSHTLNWLESTHGKCGKRGWPLWISLHGGGEVPTVVNDEQWRKHATLYQPSSGIYIAPRAPTDTWFLWHEPHIDPLLERLIEDMVALRGVDPNRVYLLGYSAGGNGVYHLAPRMADRFAAAATMAGYPTGAPQASLRNLPFAILVGRHDTTFDRLKEAEKWQVEFSTLCRQDPDGYHHFIRIYPEYGHWMKGKDAEALPWMAQFTRNPWPKKIVWVQDEVARQRFYWLEVGAGDALPGRKLIAEVKTQTISLSGDAPSRLKLWLSDELLDLDMHLRVLLNGKTIFAGEVSRSEAAIRASLNARYDPSACATALLELTPAAQQSGPPVR